MPTEKKRGPGRPRKEETYRFHVAITRELNDRWNDAKAQYETSVPYELTNNQFMAVLLNGLENSLPERRHPSMTTKIKLKEGITHEK